jgi:hypothetical protein
MPVLSAICPGSRPHGSHVAPENRDAQEVIMAKIKLTKTAVETAQTQAQPIELRDTMVPGFLCKITPADRKIFMLQYRTKDGVCSIAPTMKKNSPQAR